jgi:filamentous hemagglutinin
MTLSNLKDYKIGGAGGRWSVIDEVADPSVIQQVNRLSCGQACVGIILADRKINASQDIITKIVGDGPTYEGQLARALEKLDTSNSSTWMGAGVDPDDVASIYGLSSTGSWIAQLWDKGNKIGHWVVVDGIDETGIVLIRDPYEATKYKMNLKNFQKTWNGFAVWRQ